MSAITAGWMVLKAAISLRFLGLDTLPYFCRTRPDTIEYTGTHEATIRRRLGSPDAASQTHECRGKIDRTSAERRAERDP